MPLPMNEIESRRRVTSAPPDDALARTARHLFLAGVMAIPVLTVRVGAITISDILFLTTGGILLLRAAALPGAVRRLPPNIPWQVAALCSAFAAVTTVWRASGPAASVLVEARILFILLALPWMARTVLDTRVRIHQAIRAYLLGAAASGAVAMLQTRLAFLVPPEGLLTGRAFGLTDHPNDAGASLALAVIMAAGLLVYRGLAGQRVVAVLAILATIGLILSGSVTGMLSAVLGVTTLLVRRGVRLKAIAAIYLLLTAGYLGGSFAQSALGVDASPLARLERSTRGSVSSGENTLASRIETDALAWEQIKRNPLIGRGLDEHSGRVLDELSTHNFVLLAWFQGGLLFLFSMLLAVGSAMRAGWRRKPRDHNKETLVAAAVGMFAFSMTAPVLFQRHFWIPFVLLLAYGTVAQRTSAKAVGTELRSASQIDSGKGN